jgi:hypothetical protein
MITKALTSPTEAKMLQKVCVPMSQRNTSARSVLLYQQAPSTARL